MKSLNIKKKLMEQYKSNKFNILFILVLTVMLFAVYYDYELNTTQAAIQKGLSNSLIRFHVVANSDSKWDQELKLNVRDEVISYMQELLKDSDGIDQTREIIYNHIDEINTLSSSVIENYGAEYGVKVKLEYENFPLKTYGDIVLPPGEYEALIIEIGEAKGKNWWCVMFPPLCFVDVTHGVVPETSKQDLKGVLTEEEYNAILMTKTQDEIPVKIKFKLFDLFKPKEEESKFYVKTP